MTKKDIKAGTVLIATCNMPFGIPHRIGSKFIVLGTSALKCHHTCVDHPRAKWYWDFPTTALRILPNKIIIVSK